MSTLGGSGVAKDADQVRPADSSGRSVGAGLAGLAATLGLSFLYAGTSTVDRVAWRVALATLGVSYLSLALLLAWKSYLGIPRGGYRSGEHRRTLLVAKWLGRLLFLPLWLFAWALGRALMYHASRDLSDAFAPGERLVASHRRRDAEGVWLLSTHALYVGSWGRGFWRIERRHIQDLSTRPLGPWAHTEIDFTVTDKRGVHQVTSTFTDEAAAKIDEALRADDKEPNRA